MAALESSKKKAGNVDAYPTKNQLNKANNTESVTDLKLCQFYSHTKPNREEYEGNNYFDSHER